ncbi:MAG: response regulator [Chloroflexi bacterium]|nr:MAG: response regulator [Chloroflexota bacterium]
MPTVLIVEDQKELLLVNRIILERAGYDTIIAENGEAGLRILKDGSRAIDLVVLDDQMPDMTGLEVCHAMRSDGRLRHIPIIVYTAGSALGHNRFANTHVEHILFKPCLPHELLNTVKQVVSVTV